MPRGPRLDAPGALHHVMARGIEKRDIFADDHDRESLLLRLAHLVEEGALEVFAWALMPNHFHILLRTLHQPLSRSMRRLLTGHAVDFNRRHQRVGHLFQNRYRSIVCDEERYFLELVRYIHLNPIRRGIVPTVTELDVYPYTGHSVLMGRNRCRWQASAKVLRWFGSTRRRARSAYRAFVAAGIDAEPASDLSGGGLIRSAGGWAAVKELRRGREVFESDERILGTGQFVEAMLRDVSENGDRESFGAITLNDLIAALARPLVATHSTGWLRGTSRESRRIRAGIAFLWVHRLGRSGRALAKTIGVHTATIHRAAQQGCRDAAYWDGLLTRIATNATTSPK
jgi:putative transposase